jgi:hypothetical protein
MIIMSEALNFESADFYETPLLTEAGDFADVTKGGTGFLPEPIIGGLFRV